MKFIKSSLLFCLSFSLLSGLNLLNRNVSAIQENEIPYKAEDLVYDLNQASAYGASKLEILDSYEGSDGKVLHLSEGIKDNTGVGLFLDYSSFEISTSEILSITFVVYSYGSNIRVSKNNSWIMEATNTPKSWQTVTLSTSTFKPGKSFNDISEDGFLSSFEICGNHTADFYINSVKVKLIDHSIDPVLEEMPIVEPINGVSKMTYQQVSYYSNQQAKDNNVPEGYSGAVVKLNGRDADGGLGITLDYESQYIMINRIKSITFRIHILKDDVKEIRLTKDAKNYLVRYVPKENDLDGWFDFKIDNQKLNFYEDYSLVDLGNNGLLGKFNFGVCLNSGKDGPLYVDSITIEKDDIDFSNEFPIVPSVSGVSAYPTNLPLYYTYDEAILNNVPSGFSDKGGLLKVSSTSISMGVTFDYSKLHIKSYAVEALKIRYYLVKHGSETSSYPEMRITNCAGSGSDAWALRYLIGTSHLDEWHEITLSRDGTNFFNSKHFSYFDNEEKEIGIFELSIRNTKATTLYLDNIEFILREKDTVAPIITYTGANLIELHYGQTLSTSATAFDEYQNEEVDIYYEWESGALDEFGNPKEGNTWTCYICAKDDANNVRRVPIKVKILPQDKEAPIIHVNISTIKCKVGTIPQLNILITDNVDEVCEVIYSWSEGALDNYDKLTLGTHILSIVAKDSSNNTSSKQITFIVS